MHIGKKAGLDGVAAEGADAGMTMVEIVVSMVVMLAAMSILTGGFLQIYRATAKIDALSGAQDQVTVAFRRLDREIRYSSAISKPGVVGTDYYVEYVMSVNNTATCIELRLNTTAGQVQRRSWPKETTPPGPTAWQPLISSVTPAQPFTLLEADPVHNYQRLNVALSVLSGNGGSATRRATNVTFVALNTPFAAPQEAVCTQGRAVP